MFRFCMTMVAAGNDIFLIYTILLWNVVNTVKSEGSGGLCLSHAQYECLQESNDLINAKFTQPNNKQLICSTFGKYNKCIQLMMTTCDFTEGERELYKTAYEDFFRTPPFNCRNDATSSEWKHESSARTSNSHSLSTSVHGNSIKVLVTVAWIICICNKHIGFV